MRILILLGNYYPNSSSAANCAKFLLSSLVQEGHRVDIISNINERDETEKSISNNIYYHGIPDKYAYYVGKINRYFSDKYPKSIYMFLAKFVKIPFYIRFQIFSKEKNMGGWSISKSVNRIIQLDKDQSFDLMISFSQPFTTHLIAYRYLRKCSTNLRWIVYEYDPYSLSAVISKVNLFAKYQRRIQENRVFKLADKIILTKEIYDFYLETAFRVYRDKFYFLDYRLLQFPDTLGKSNFSEEFDEGTLYFVYAGGFYEKIRNPLYMLEVFEELTIEHRLILLTNYQEKEFISFIKRYPQKFVLEVKNTHEYAISMMKRANILVSIGNMIKIQVPAKVFEYLGLGKPIIHFAKIKDDPIAKYLDYYPLALIINEYEGSIAEKVEAIERFVEEVKNKKLTYNEVVECLPNHDEKIVAGKFLSIINSI